MSEVEDVIQRGLVAFFEEKIPFNKLLGMKVVSIAEGCCEMSIPIRPELVGDPSRPALHGGVISALADTVGGLARAGKGVEMRERAASFTRPYTGPGTSCTRLDRRDGVGWVMHVEGRVKGEWVYPSGPRACGTSCRS